MANLITSVDSIATSEYELYLKPLLNDPQFQSLPFNFAYGNMPRDIFFNTNADKITGAKTGCGWTFRGDSVTFNKKTLNPVELQAPVEQCYSVLLKKLFGDKLPDGALRGELSAEVVDFMLTQQMYSFNRDLLSIFMLGDTAVSDSPAYYSLLNGFYTKLIAGEAASDGTVDAGGIVAADLLPGAFFAKMKTVYDAQPRLLKNIPNNKKVWIWTQALYDAYLAYLQEKTQVTAGVIQTEYITDGVQVNAFLGVPIVVLGIVDERLETDFLDPSSQPENPYRCVLTDPTNHIILMDGTGFKDSNMWYEKIDDKVYVTGSALIDYQYGYGELNVFAGIS